MDLRVQFLGFRVFGLWGSECLRFQGFGVWGRVGLRGSEALSGFSGVFGCRGSGFQGARV